jgi:hypothetical protein
MADHHARPDRARSVSRQVLQTARGRVRCAIYTRKSSEEGSNRSSTVNRR